MPVGLCGELTISARVRGVIAARMRVDVDAKPCPSLTSGTVTRWQPAIATTGE